MSDVAAENRRREALRFAGTDCPTCHGRLYDVVEGAFVNTCPDCADGTREYVCTDCGDLMLGTPALESVLRTTQVCGPCYRARLESVA